MRTNTETIVEFPEFGGVAASIVVENGGLTAYPVEKGEDPENWKLCDDSGFTKNGQEAKETLEHMGIELIDATTIPEIDEEIEEEAERLVEEMLEE